MKLNKELRDLEQLMREKDQKKNHGQDLRNSRHPGSRALEQLQEWPPCNHQTC